MSEEQNNKMSLVGKTAIDEHGMFGAEITLTTPDGKETSINSGYVYRSETEAKNALDSQINAITKTFTDMGAIETSRTEGMLQ